MAVHLLHGCAPRWLADRQSLRNFVSEAALRSYLKTRPSKYEAAPSPQGPDVLTIDDSTKGAARAAAMAREYGHDVLLFVNPHQIISRQPYYFSLLNAYLDNRRESKVIYHGKEYDLSSGVRAFRLAAKRVLSRLDPQRAIEQTAGIGALLNCAVCDVPEYAQTLELDELLHLRDMGVRIENHGWSHQRIDALSPRQLEEDVAAAQGWLRDRVGARPCGYAVPFGETERATDTIERLAEAVFLADMGREPGRIAGRTWNRTEITRDLQQ